jgi:hypothetical protein
VVHLACVPAGGRHLRTPAAPHSCHCCLSPPHGCCIACCCPFFAPHAVVAPLTSSRTAAFVLSCVWRGPYAPSFPPSHFRAVPPLLHGATAPRVEAPNPVSERLLVQRWPRTGRKTVSAAMPRRTSAMLSMRDHPHSLLRRSAPAAAATSAVPRYAARHARFAASSRQPSAPPAVALLFWTRAGRSSAWGLSSRKEARVHSLVGLCEKQVISPCAPSCIVPSVQLKAPEEIRQRH